MTRATTQRRESHRASVLKIQLEHWTTASALGDYLAAMDQRISKLSDLDARAAATECLAWARQYAAALDPLKLRW